MIKVVFFVLIKMCSVYSVCSVCCVCVYRVIFFSSKKSYLSGSSRKAFSCLKHTEGLFVVNGNYRFRFRYAMSFGIGILSLSALTENAKILVSVKMMFSVVHLSFVSTP
jgi:hypothetical protein